MPLGESFETVLAAAREGADWAWSALFRDLAGPVTGYLRSRGASEPDDLTGEVFLQLARDIHRFAGDEQGFRAWVFVITHRRLLDERRARGRRRLETTPLAGDETDPAGGDVEEEALNRLMTEELQTLLEDLTEDQRDVLALRIVAGLTLEDTAHVLGKRLGAVKALQRRALVSVRRRIFREGVTL